MIRDLVKKGNEFMNSFGTKDSVSDGLSPQNIIDKLSHVDNNDLKYEYGQYVQLHVTQKVTNRMKSTTIGEIVLSMSLDTGEKIDMKVFAMLPITVDFFQRVKTIGQTQQQPFKLF